MINREDYLIKIKPNSKLTKGTEYMISIGTAIFDKEENKYYTKPNLRKTIPNLEEYKVPKVLAKMIRLVRDEKIKYAFYRTGKSTGKSVNVGAYENFRKLYETKDSGYIACSSKTLKKNKETILQELIELVMKLAKVYNFDISDWDWSNSRAAHPFFESIVRPIEFKFGSFETADGLSGFKIAGKPCIAQWMEELVMKNDRTGISSENVIESYTANEDTLLRIDSNFYDNAKELQENQVTTITQNNWNNGKQIHDHFFNDYLEQDDEIIKRDGYQYEVLERGYNGEKTLIFYAISTINNLRGEARIKREQWLLDNNKKEEYEVLVWGRDSDSTENPLLRELENLETIDKPDKYLKLLGGVDFAFGKDALVTTLLGLRKTDKGWGLDILEINEIDTRKIKRTNEKLLQQKFLLPRGVLKPLQKWTDRYLLHTEHQNYKVYCDSRDNDRIQSLNSMNWYVNKYSNKKQKYLPVLFVKAGKFKEKTNDMSLHNKIDIWSSLMSFGNVRVLKQTEIHLKNAIKNVKFIWKDKPDGDGQIIKEATGKGADIIDAVCYAFSRTTNILSNTIKTEWNKQKKK